jgi:hypothetical protein
MLEKRDPQMSGLAAETNGGNQEIENLPKRVDRYGQAKARSREMQAFLRDQPLYVDEYRKLRDCGNWLLFRHYYTVGKVRLHNACLCRKHLLCPLCAILRASKFLRRYVERFRFVNAENEALRASMVTLTVKNGKRLRERFEHLKSSYAKLEKARRNAQERGHNTEWGKVLGLVGTYEFTNKGKGWHAHMHILVLHREKIYTGSLAKLWKRITGDSMMVDITPLHHPDAPEMDFLEVFKYSLKFSEMSLDDNLHAYMVLSGKRLVFSAGLLRGVKVPENYMDDAIDPADLPYIEMMYRYQDGSGYNLTHYQERAKQCSRPSPPRNLGPSLRGEKAP